MKQETKPNPMKGYNKTDRNFDGSGENMKQGNKGKSELKPEKFPVADASLKNSK